MNKLSEAITEIEESVTELEMLNELVNALSLAQSSNTGKLSSTQTELALSSVYSKIASITTNIRNQVDNLYEANKIGLVMSKGKL